MQHRSRVTYGGAQLILGLGDAARRHGQASTMLVALATADKESFLAALTMSGDQGLTDVTETSGGLNE